MVGPSVNTLPIRINLERISVSESVQRTHVLLADLLRHEHASLALAQRSSGVPLPAPLFTSLLNYRHGDDAAQGPEKCGTVCACSAAKNGPTIR
jgi:hypothetical protein